MRPWEIVLWLIVAALVSLGACAVAERQTECREGALFCEPWETP